MISVLIPVLNGGADLARCLTAIADQEVDEEVEIVVVDSGSTDGSGATAKRLGARVHEIPPTEFGHGRTRNLAASLSSGDVLVFTTHDAVAVHRDWLAHLAAAVRSGDPVGGAYGRQLPHDDARPPEQFFLEFLYGPDPRVQTIGERDELTYEATLFSNVNSAMQRSTWERFPFSDSIIMSEDQQWSRRVLQAGHSIVYEPRAAVRHSHRYTVRAALRRFFDSGVSSRQSYVEGPASRKAIRRAAVRYGRNEVGWLWSSGNRRWIPYAAVYESAKFVGLQLGLHHEHVPARVKQRLGYYRRNA